MIVEPYIRHAAAFVVAEHRGQAEELVAQKLATLERLGDSEGAAVLGAILTAITSLRAPISGYGWHRPYLNLPSTRAAQPSRSQSSPPNPAPAT
jgi:hypothetical protein